MYFLIMVYGSREWEKIRAVNLLLIFTIYSGMLMLLSILKMYLEIGSVNTIILYYIGLGSINAYWRYSPSIEIGQ